MAVSSSRDLHPEHGGRFVLTRASQQPPEYAVAIYLPEARRLDTTLRWEDGQARLEPEVPDAWAQAEALKLARVLRRNLPPSLTRWRGR